MKKIVSASLAIAMFFAGITAAQAQAQKPVAVVSLSGYDELMKDVDFLGGVAGQPGASGMVDGFLKLFTQGQGLKGLDKTKPWGIAVTTGGSDFNAMVFLPVANVKEFLAGLQGVVGPAQEAGGVYTIVAPNGDEVFVREQAGWAYITQTKDAPLPAGDPVALLGGLNKEYDVAAKAMIQNIPQDAKDSAIDQLKSILEFAAQQQPNEDEATAELRRKTLQQQTKQIEKFAKEANEITLGWKIDSVAKNTYIDMTITAVPGTSLDKQMQQMTETRSDFAGFLLPDAAMTMNLSGKYTQEDIEGTLLTLEQVRKQAENSIDEDANLPSDEARTEVKKVLNQFMDVLVATIKSGKMDGGAALLMNPGKLQFGYGGYVADGAALETAVKNLIELAKGEPQFNELAKIALNLETYKNVRFHHIAVTVPDEDARKVVGDVLDVYFGAGPQSAYVAAGKDSLAMVKGAIDSSASAAGKVVPPFQMTIAMAPIFAFAASIEPNPIVAMLAEEFAKNKGKDRVLVNARPISSGVTYRFEIEEGILKAFGAAAKQAGGGGRGL